MKPGTRVVVLSMGEELPGTYMGPSGYVDYANKDMPAIRLDGDEWNTLVAWAQVRAS